MLLSALKVLYNIKSCESFIIYQNYATGKYVCFYFGKWSQIRNEMVFLGRSFSVISQIAIFIVRFYNAEEFSSKNTLVFLPIFLLIPNESHLKYNHLIRRQTMLKPKLNRKTLPLRASSNVCECVRKGISYRIIA